MNYSKKNLNKSAQALFLKDEIWLLTFGGSFQRNTVYKKEVSEKDRNKFRGELRSFLETEILPIYLNDVNDKVQYNSLTKIIQYSNKHKLILENDSLSIGTAQKLLNLVLKYYWCLGWLPEPPHFPVDSRIQKCIPAKSRKSWTAINSLEEYQSIIDCAKEQLKEGESLAKWELANFKKG